MTNKNIVKKAVILLVAAFLMFSGMAYRAKGETLYTLENLISNGDFSDGTTGWTTESYNILTATNGYASVVFNGNTPPTTSFINVNQSLVVIENHIYYCCFNYKTNIQFVGTSNIRAYFTPPTTYFYSGIGVYDDNWHTLSGIFTATQNTLAFFVFTGRSANSNDINIGEYIYFDNIMLFDLTATFGMGFEPSLTDFETLYLPDTDYFDSYVSYIPESLNSVNLSDYTDVGEDLTAIDFTKSVISEYGKNMSLELYAYFLDPPYGNPYDPLIYDSDVLAQYCRDFYLYYNTPTMRYLDKNYTLSWAGVDESGRMLRLDLSDHEEDILKRILFNRTVDFSDEYFTIAATPVYDPFGAGEEYPLDWQIRFYFVLTSTFNMNVNIAQTLISMSIDTDIDEYTTNDWALYGFNTMYFNFYNQYDQIFLPSLMVNNDTRAPQTRMIDNFGTLYTNVKRMTFGWQMASPNSNIDADATYIDYSIHELGAFSEQQIVMPVYIDPDSDLAGINDIFEPTIVEWWDIGGHLKNVFNSIINTIWIKWDLRGLIATFDDVISKVADVGALLPPAVWTVIAVVFSVSAIGLIFVLVDKAGD
ncbi:MAG: hypothetical protein M0R51_12795 [Clostridia bacterium]|nr:hypothetical protein [Clostridia bacterium]